MSPRRSEHWEARIREVEQQSALVCQRALERTPPEYREHIVFIEQKRKIGEDPEDRAAGRPRAYFATVRTPYMTVDGRISMAVDEHRAQGKQIRIGRPRIETDPHTKQLLCYVTVDCPLRGRATGVARVILSDAGVNATNPVENAQTSAVGRALGFLGYGVYGSGIASADEVMAVLAHRGEAPQATAGRADSGHDPAPATAVAEPSPSPQSSTGAVGQATEADIQRLAQTLGLRRGELDLMRAQLGAPEAVLDRLKAMADPAGKPAEGKPAAPEAPDAEPAQSADHLAERARAGQLEPSQFMAAALALGATETGYRAWLKHTYGQDNPGKLSQAQAERERLFFRSRFGAQEARENFLGKCRRLGAGDAA